MTRSLFVILASLFGGGGHSWISTRSSKSNAGGERERGPLERCSMQSHLHTVQNKGFLTSEPEQIDVDLNGKAAKKSTVRLGLGVRTRQPEMRGTNTRARKGATRGGEGFRASLPFSKTISEKSPNRETFKANLQIEIEKPSRYA
jgi:hypothetical protein